MYLKTLELEESSKQLAETISLLEEENSRLKDQISRAPQPDAFASRIQELKVFFSSFLLVFPVENKRRKEEEDWLNAL